MPFWSRKPPADDPIPNGPAAGLAESAPLRSESGPSGPASSGAAFEVGAVVKIVGMGVVLAGTVKSGVLRVGMHLHLQQSAVAGPRSPVDVDVRKIVWGLQHRVELYEGQYEKSLAEVGPGIGIAIGVKGVDKDDLRAGDLLAT